MQVMAVDVGVGQIRAGLVAPGRQVVEFQEYQTVQPLGADATPSPANTCTLIRAIAQKVLQNASLEWNEVAGLGVALPMPVTQNGVAGRTQAFPLWNGVNVSQLMRNLFPEVNPRQIALINDANCGALGEWMYGGAQGNSQVTLIYFVVRSGLGAGLIVDGALHVGTRGTAGEWGHVVVDPQGPKCEGCGLQKGCLETLASGHAIASMAVESFKKGKLGSVLNVVLGRGPAKDADIWQLKADSGGGAQFSLPDLEGGKPFIVYARDVIAAERLGDEDAIAILSDAGSALGKAIVQAYQIFNPDRIVIGGVVTESQESQSYFNAAVSWATTHVPPQVFGRTLLYTQELSDDNYLLGAAASVFGLLEKQPPDGERT